VTVITCFHLIVAAIVVASVSVWCRIVWKRSARIELIAYRPRHDVPWSAGHLGIVIFIVLSLQVAAQGIAHVDLSHGFASLSSAAKARFVTSLTVANLAGMLAATLLVVAASGAKRRDLGLPEHFGELIDDLRTGLLGFLAAVVPIYGMKLVLSFIQLQLGQKPVDHPFLEMLEQDPFGAGAAVVAVAAVVAAPLTEEFAFRLLLQGWLEKIERRWPGDCQASAPRVVAEQDDTAVSDPIDTGAAERVTVEALVHGRQTDEPGIAGAADRGVRPHLQWRSIVVSSALFGLMHFGTGLDPIPLFFLGAILGYLYNKTHHLLPCMVVHGLFNGFSLAWVWLPMAVKWLT